MLKGLRVRLSWGKFRQMQINGTSKYVITAQERKIFNLVKTCTNWCFKLNNWWGQQLLTMVQRFCTGTRYCIDKHPCLELPILTLSIQAIKKIKIKRPCCVPANLHSNWSFKAHIIVFYDYVITETAK